MKTLLLGLLGITVAGFGCSTPAQTERAAAVVLAERPARNAGSGSGATGGSPDRGPIRDRRFDWR